MHVAFVVNNYLPRIGGVEVHVHALAAKLVETGHQATVITLAPTPGDSTEQGIRVLRLREHCRVGDVLAFPGLGAAVGLKGLLRELGVDLVSVHTRFFPMTWLGVLAARRNRIPVVLTEHGSDHVVSEHCGIQAGARLVDYTLGRLAHRRASAVLGVSESVVEFVRRLSGVHAELFYNAIELGAATASPPQRPNELVFVGRLVAGKGWRTFIEAVKTLRARGLDVHGTMIGGGPDEDAARQDAPDEVQVLGRLLPSQVAEHLAGATLVNPTTLSEGFHTTLLEALAAGGRVVTYRVPGAQALADDGAPVTITDQRNLVGLTSSLQEVLRSPPTPYPRSKLERWSWDARARQFVEIAETVLA